MRSRRMSTEELGGAWIEATLAKGEPRTQYQSFNKRSAIVEFEALAEGAVMQCKTDGDVKRHYGW